MFQPQGSSPHLHWLSQRLQTHGLLQPAGCALPAWLPAEWEGFAGEACWLDLSDDSSQQLALRATQCRQQGMTAVEVRGQWLPQGEQLGFLLLCGGELPLPAPALAWLDSNAPLPGGWLHCGPLGSARYTRHVIDAMQHAWQLALRQLPAGTPPSAVNWEVAMQQQFELADRLFQLSRHYLQQHGISSSAIDAGAVRSQFALPPGQQTHFAANLALLIVTAMQQRDTLHSLLQQVFASLQPAAAA